ncbi:hypothetical protein [Streptomyces sp. NPDC058086]|uniref:hypothetical protein n=1 Tax=Streptomyces sp. NPDC058086 TaxID=3346334 RepID=UPI0036E5F7F7
MPIRAVDEAPPPMRIGTPEWPLWLVSKGPTADAREAIERALGRTVPVEELPAVPVAERSVARSRFRDLFQGTWLRRTLFRGLFCMCRITPMFALYTFGPASLGSFGPGGSATSIAVVIGMASWLCQPLDSGCPQGDSLIARCLS